MSLVGVRRLLVYLEPPSWVAGERVLGNGGPHPVGKKQQSTEGDAAGRGTL